MKRTLLTLGLSAMLAMPLVVTGQQTPTTPGMSSGSGSSGMGTGSRMDHERGQQSMGQEQIKQAQKQLKEAGFDPGPIDGQIGAQTRQALREFQESHGLPQTGQLDEATKTQLMARSGQESPGSMPGGRLSNEPRPGSSMPGGSMPGGRTSDEPRPGSSMPSGSGSGR
jgi:peptidoglycan hydrolase-like protein with peptidoglycan-binding domain